LDVVIGFCLNRPTSASHADLQEARLSPNAWLPWGHVTLTRQGTHTTIMLLHCNMWNILICISLTYSHLFCSVQIYFWLDIHVWLRMTLYKTNPIPNLGPPVQNISVYTRRSSRSRSVVVN
jgi:hypothetical protein